MSLPESSASSSFGEKRNLNAGSQPHHSTQTLQKRSCQIICKVSRRLGALVSKLLGGVQLEAFFGIEQNQPIFGTTEDLATIWEGMPFIVIALLWLFVLILLLTVRTALYLRGEGFLPSAYRSLLASKYGAIFKVCTVTTLAVHVTSLIIFCWYGILAQREGMNLTRTLFSQHDSMSQTMTQLGKDADFIEGVVNGTIPVSGQLINGTFAPDPPSLLPHSQAVLSQLEIVNSVSSSVHSSSRNAFTAFIFMIVLSTVLNSAIFILAAFSLGFENRKLMMITAFSLPIAAFLLWCTVAATYGVWISAKDICSASALYSGSGSSSITDAIQTRLAPCPAPQSAALLGEHGKRAYLALVRRANQLVSDQYNQPPMANFVNDPLLCEPYVWQPSTSSFLTVRCPYPTTLTRFTVDSWQDGVAGALCTGNSDIQCAAEQTPLTVRTHNAVVHTLQVAKIDARLITAATQLASCQHTKTVLERVTAQHCGRRDLRRSLLVSWVSSCVLGGAGLFLFTALFLVHRTTPLSQTNSFAAAFGPGIVVSHVIRSLVLPRLRLGCTEPQANYSEKSQGRTLPFNAVATGYRKEDYHPGEITSNDGTWTSAYKLRATAGPDVSQLETFLMTSHPSQTMAASPVADSAASQISAVLPSCDSMETSNNPLYNAPPGWITRGNSPNTSP